MKKLLSNRMIRMAMFWMAPTLLVFAPFHALAQIEWRLSIKLIANVSGNAPLGAFDNVSNDVRRANDLLAGYARGYRFRITEIVTLTGVSQWFDVNPRDSANKSALQAAARNDPALYAWRSDSINLYANNRSSGICSFPGTGDDIIFIGGNVYPTLVLHESGHFFNLRHTHEGERFLNGDGSACENRDCACAQLLPGESDFTLETAGDHECYGSRDAIALGNFNLSFNNLDSDRQELVNNTWRNIMSYHPSANLDILTPDQLDFMSDASDQSRNNVASGKTIWVNLNHTCSSPNNLSEPYRTIANALTDIPDGERLCRNYVLTPGSPFPPLAVNLGGPYRKFSDGLDRATDGDVILMRTGHYDETATITKRVMLAATRGSVVIGAP